MSLTTCLKRAGKNLNTEDKNAILEAARVNRKAGMSADEAAKAAVRARLEEVQALLAAEQGAEPMVSTWTGSEPAAPKTLKERAEAMAAPKPQRSLQEQVERPAAPDAVVASVGDPEAKGERKFYVTMVRGDRVARLAGPFDTKEEAEAMKPRAQDEANKADPRSAFDAFGVSAITSEDHKPGTLNERLGIGKAAAAAETAPTDAEPAAPAQPAAASAARAESAARRVNPVTTIDFAKPIVGPTGARLKSYTWQWKPMEFVDARGEERVKRISDWDASEASGDTGREVVHQFVVDDGGADKVVSAESALKLLGFTAGSDGKAGFTSLSSAAKTLARLRMQEAELQQAKEQFDRDNAAVMALPLPAMPTERDGKGWFNLGDASVRQLEPGAMTDERRRSLIGAWRDNRMAERGWRSGSEDSLRVGLRETADRIKRQQAKVDRLVTASAAPPAQQAEPSAPAPAEPTTLRFPATAAGAVQAFNADDAEQAKAIIAKLRTKDALREVGEGTGFRMQIGEGVEAFKKRINEVADRLTKTALEQGARERVLYDKLMDRAMEYDRAADHAARAKANGVADDSTAYDSFYRPMGGGETEMVRIPELLERLAADVRSLKDDPDYAKVSAMVREKRPRIFDAADKPTLKQRADSMRRKPEGATKIGDFGEKLEGARKDYATTLKDAEAVDVAAEPLSKSWPEPDYQKLLDSGVDPYIVALVRAARDEVPTKPQKSWKLKGWVDTVKSLRETARSMLAGDVTAADARRIVNSTTGLIPVRGRAELYEELGHDRSLKGVTFGENFYSFYRGQNNVRKWVVEQKAKATAFSNWPRELAVADTREAALQAFKDKLGTLDLGGRAKGQPQFVIYRKRGQEGAFVGKKIGREYIDLHKAADVAAARAYMQSNAADLEKALEAYKATPFERKTENQPRVGDDHRNGAPVTPEVFAETFGFRGVQFGNYVEQGRRQSDLNEAFDGLMDLAAILGIPPRALSLNGQLGLAFGARGKGGTNAAAAHYEPDKVVINLTKGSGAGSLAHEWWHALDNYFAKKGESTGFVTGGAKAAALREQMRAAFEAVKRATSGMAYQQRARELDKRRSKPYWNTPEERSARAFESYVIAKLQDQGVSNDYLANVVSEQFWNASEALRAGMFSEGENKPTYPYPLPSELPAVRAGFDEFFKTVETSTDESGNVALFSRTGNFRADGFVSPRTLRDEVAKIVANWDQDLADVEVVNRVEDLPADIQRAVRNVGSENTVRGLAMPDGRVYLVAENISTIEEGKFVLFHEVYGHVGMRAFLGDSYGQQMRTLRQANPALAKEADRWFSSFGEDEIAARVAAGFTETKARKMVEALAVEEALADRAGTLPELKGWQRLMAALQRGLRRLGLGSVADMLEGMTEAETLDLLVQARRTVQAGQRMRGAEMAPAMSRRTDQTQTPEFKRWFGDSKVVDAEGKPLVVYHGTASDISEFKAGPAYREGHGKQMPGIYFSPMPATAAAYARTAANAKDASTDINGANVIPAYVAITNPAEFTDPAEFGRANRAKLEAAGHDGAVRRNAAGEVVEIVAFRPEQIKSAIGNTGSFDPTNADIRFSRRTSQDILNTGAAPSRTEQARDIRQKVRTTVQDMLGSTGAKMSLWDKTLGTQYAKAEKSPEFKRVFDAVQQYLDDTSTMANEAADKAKHILPKLESAKDVLPNAMRKPENRLLSTTDAEAIAGPIFTGTLTDKKVYDDEELRTKFNLTREQIGHYREFMAAVNTSLDQAVAVDVLKLVGDKNPALRELALTDRAAFRQGLTEYLAGEAEASGEDLMAADEDAGEWTKLLRQVSAKYTAIDNLKAEGYAPLMRFGQYKVHVTGKDGETLFFGLYETRLAANRMARELAEDPEFKDASIERGVLSQEQYKLFSGLPLDSLEMFANAIGADQSAVFQEFLKLAKSNRSAMKRLIRRKGTAGFSEDVPRVLAAFITSNARMAAGGLNMPAAKEAAQGIRDGDVQDEAIKLIDTVQNPTETAGMFRGLMFVNFIGGSIASAIVNLTQPLTMTLPYLSQWGGAKKAAARLMAAGKMTATGKVDDLGLRAALKRAENDGIVSPQEIHFLTAQAMGTWGSNPFVQRAAFIWAAPFSLAEQFNRRSSFIAAYLTAKEQGLPDAFGFAEKAVIETQGLYNRANAPNWARNPVGASVLTFKQFSIHYLEWMGRMYRSGPEGKKAVLLALAMLMLAAGTEGLPFADDLDDLVDTIGQALGEDTNFKKARRDFLANTLGLGDEAADIISRGTSAVPGMPLDYSLRMSMGNLLPATGLLLRSNTDKSRDVLELAGPAGGLISQYSEAASKLLAGDATGAAVRAIPVAFQNAAKGVGMWQTGEARDTLDRKIMDADATDGLMKFLGFQPQAIARESDKLQMIRRSEQLAKNVEGEIAAKWARAVADRDPEAIQAAKDELRDWNESNPESPIRITGAQIMQRVRKLRQERSQRFITATSPERRQAVTEAIQ